MNAKTTVTASMLAVGALVFLSRGWFTTIREWVYGVTGKSS